MPVINKIQTNDVYTIHDSRFDNIIYVDNYGAKGDGTTDSTSAIQTAINENPNSKISFKGGKYLITNPIQINNFSGINLDLGGSILTTNTDINAILVVGDPAGVNSSDIIQNGCIDCNNHANIGIQLKGYLNFFSNITILDPKQYGIKDDNTSNSPQKIFNNIYICKKDTSPQFAENLVAIGMSLKSDNILNNIHIGRFYKSMQLTGDFNLLNNIHIWTEYKTTNIDVSIFNASIGIEFNDMLSANNVYLDNYKYGFYSTNGGSCNIDNLQIIQIGVTSAITNVYILRNVNNTYRLNITTLSTVKNLKILPELNTGFVSYSHNYGDISLNIPNYNEPLQTFDIHDCVKSNQPRFCINGDFSAGAKYKIGELRMPQSSSELACKIKISNRQYGYHEVLVNCTGNSSGVGVVNRVLKILNPSPNNDYGIGVYARNENLEDVTYNVFDIYVYMINSGSISLTLSIEKLTPMLCVLKDTRDGIVGYSNTGVETPMTL